MSTAADTALRPDARERRAPWEVAAWTVATFVAGSVVPGAGLVIAMILAFTRLRAHPVARVALVVLGLVLGYLALMVYLPGSATLDPGTVVQVP